MPWYENTTDIKCLDPNSKESNMEEQERKEDILTIPSVVYLRLEESLRKLSTESLKAIALANELQESLEFYKSEDKLDMELIKTLLKKFKIYTNAIQDLLES